LARRRGKTGEACSLFGIEAAEFGHVDEQGASCRLRYARDADENGKAPGKAFIGFDMSHDLRLDSFDLLFDVVEALCIELFQQRQSLHLAAVLCSRAIFHQRKASDMKLLEAAEHFTCNRPRLKAEDRTHAGEQSGVEMVRLGELTGGFRNPSTGSGAGLGAD